MIIVVMICWEPIFKWRTKSQWCLLIYVYWLYYEKCEYMGSSTSASVPLCTVCSVILTNITIYNDWSPDPSISIAEIHFNVFLNVAITVVMLGHVSEAEACRPVWTRYVSLCREPSCPGRSPGDNTTPQPSLALFGAENRSRKILW